MCTYNPLHACTQSQNAVQYCNMVGKFTDIDAVTSCKKELTNKDDNGETIEAVPHPPLLFPCVHHHPLRLSVSGSLCSCPCAWQARTLCVLKLRAPLWSRASGEAKSSAHSRRLCSAIYSRATPRRFLHASSSILPSPAFPSSTSSLSSCPAPSLSHGLGA
jgi:hypothetical protein